MTIYVDQCRWSARNHSWCHMVSDTSLDDLHVFAELIGIPRRAFHGDHYDLPQHIREKAISHGAQEVTSRRIVQILSTAGLRLSPQQRRAYKHGVDNGQGSGALVSDRGK